MYVTPARLHCCEYLLLPILYVCMVAWVISGYRCFSTEIVTVLRSSLSLRRQVPEGRPE